jgi:hypothetical protein
MSSIFDMLVGKGLINDYPSFIKHNIHYEAMVGSISYGVDGDASDVDVYGFCMPPKHYLFPYQNGHFYGFGEKPPEFKQFQKHHIFDKDSDKEYDIVIHNIVKFFDKCMGANPNMIDSLFVPQRCVLSCSSMGEYVRANRKIFLSKLCWHKFKGYAYSQLSKMNNKASKEFVDLCNHYDWPLDITVQQAVSVIGFKDVGYVEDVFKKIDQNGKRSKRLPDIKKYGYDVKFAYNVVRLLEECQQILEEGDLDLTRSREILKSIRRGEWAIEKVQEFFDTKYPILERAYEKSKLPHAPREDDIRELLYECVHMHYGDLGGEMAKSVDVGVEKSLFQLQADLDNIVRRIG